MPHGCNGRPPGASLWAKSVDILTPPSLLSALGAIRVDSEELGGWSLSRDAFAVDPCASQRQPWPTARTMFTEDADGFSRAWRGECWLNPPYGRELYPWLSRLADHGNGLALLYARTDTVGFRSHVWERATAVYFFTGRLWFHAPVTGEQLSQNCGGPMCLAVYGAKSLSRVKRLTRPNSSYPGAIVELR